MQQRARSSLPRQAALVAGGALLLACADQALRIRRAVVRSERVPAIERRLARPCARVLIVGDSTGVGVGAGAPEMAIAGRLAQAMPDVDIVNLSRIGMRIADVADQLEQCGDQPAFDLALLHAGGNDILQGTPRQKLADDASRVLCRLRAMAAQGVWLGPADVGIAPVWRWPLRLLMSGRTRTCCQLFERLARGHGIEFVGFHGTEHSAEFRRHPKRYFAPDGIHPSAEGYGYCFERLSACSALCSLSEIRHRRAASSTRAPRHSAASPIERAPAPRAAGSGFDTRRRTAEGEQALLRHA